MCKRLCIIYIIVMASNSTSPPSEDNTSETDLSIIPTEDEKQIDTTDWMPAKHKKLQHMKEFHEEYQCFFGKKASISNHNEKLNHPYEPTYARICV